MLPTISTFLICRFVAAYGEPEAAAISPAEYAQHPCHCLTVFVPLVDLTAENGATRYLPGTHHSVLSTAALEAEASEAGSSSGAGSE